MARAKPCPLCGKPQTPAHTPFCSQGCRDRDLLKWLGEGYAIPAGPSNDEEETRSGVDSAGNAD
ncbi:DNA gyrase inhibitor YacG [Sphingomonas immobilis]|uniref:DNA gyrase inhibitor YacG n=1 Tax=Sphingomonas immobilis TaxID=3063997 RepID=A0ABT9A2R4_9SPHN|nr:DNA gyrase inhibitor YacG [Sphingomonas sp. CA1-15]MDO7844134.1 DNA gyrase inhibitor YacG [Sphingomonas sp. CA1-15]